MPDFSSSKTQNPRCRQRQRGFLKQRKERTRRRIRLMSRKELSFSLTYIVYQIFWLVQIFVGFFRWRLPATDIQRPSAGAYLSAGLRNLEFRQQLFAQSYLYTDTGERILPLATVLPSGLTGPHSPARPIFFIWQISSFCL